MILATILAASLTGQGEFERVALAGNALFDDLGTYWQEHMEAYGVTGFAVVAIKEGEVVLLDAIGDSDPFAEKKADIDTRYYIASITKTMTAAGIAQLAEQGKIDLDAPVKSYLPRFDLADSDYASKVTVRDLLSHKPGINGGDVVLLDAFTGGITEDRYYRMLAASTPAKEITYSNVHYTILGRVIEAVSGKKWQDYLADHVFAPAKMDRTTAYVSATHADPNWAVPLVVGRNGPRLAPYMKTDRTMHAAGGLLTTPRDLARYLKMYLAGGMAEGTRVLSNESVKHALSLQSKLDSTNGTIRKIDGFGYAWQVGGYRDEPRFAAQIESRC
ncbi:MAG: beta-lactamase family protein [Armatimonadetes bacterium]|nr:beta-lactamase family protein [Armatimonadota bacterium]